MRRPRRKSPPTTMRRSPLPPFDEKAPILKGTPKRYFIRKINLRGIEFLNKNVVQASTGLVPGDSIYLPNENIADVIGKLWNQRLFADVKVGATIEGDSVDLDIAVRERPRVYRWLFEGEGIGKGPPEGHHREAATQNGRRALGLRDRQEHEAHQEILRREGVPKRRGQRAHRERSGHPECRERDLRDRPQAQSQDRQDQLQRQRTVQGQAAAPHLQEDPPEGDQLLQVVETQGSRLRNRQGEPGRLLQLQRLPQLHGSQRLDLPDQRPPAGHRPHGVGGQQILHPQHRLGRQLGLPHRPVAAHVRRQAGRHLRQEDDQQAAGLRQGGQSRGHGRSSRSIRTTAI